MHIPVRMWRWIGIGICFKCKWCISLVIRNNWAQLTYRGNSKKGQVQSGTPLHPSSAMNSQSQAIILPFYFSLFQYTTKYNCYNIGLVLKISSDTLWHYTYYSEHDLNLHSWLWIVEVVMPNLIIFKWRSPTYHSHPVVKVQEGCDTS